MANTIQVKRGADASLPTLNAGEFGFSTDTHQTYIGDGAVNHELTSKASIWLGAETAGLMEVLRDVMYFSARET